MKLRDEETGRLYVAKESYVQKNGVLLVELCDLTEVRSKWHQIESCYTCKYWLKIDTEIGNEEPDAYWGQCRRYPPTLSREINDYGIDINQHPITDGIEWCGEYKEE